MKRLTKRLYSSPLTGEEKGEGVPLIQYPSPQPSPARGEGVYVHAILW